MTKLTEHHRVPKSRGGTYDSNNILRITDAKHRAFHMIFDNLTPVLQMHRLRNMNYPALSNQFVHEVTTLLDKYKGENELYAYRNGVLIPSKFLTK